MTALTHKDRVLEISTTTGTGNVLLGGPQNGYYTFFSSFGAGVQVGYVISNPITGENEVGKGTIIDNGDSTYSIRRDVIERSSNANALVNFQGGRKTVANVLLATEADDLANLANCILKDGSVAFTASQPMGGHKITGLADPTAGTDAANKEYVDAGDAATITTVETWVTAHFGAGNVTTTDPTVVKDVPAWDSTTGDLRPSTNVQIDSGHQDKLLYWASVAAFDTAADAATITFNLDLSNQWQTTLGGNRTLAISNASPGQMMLLKIKQDGTGNRVPTWFANINWRFGLQAILDPTAGGWDTFLFFCTGLDGYGVPIWDELLHATSAPLKTVNTNTYASTTTFDTRVSRNQLLVMTASPTLAVQSLGLYKGLRFELTLTQGAGGQTVTWWSNITWAGGVPTLSTAANASDVFAFECIDSATPKWRGYVIGQGI